MATTTPVFTAGGLASGLDTNTIVDKLVAIESQPITANNQKQAALTVQISSIGDLMSKIQSLASSASSLSSGVTAHSVVTAPSGVTAVAGTGSLSGTYSIAVTTAATIAKARSNPFASASTKVAGGALQLNVQGVAKTINITANSDLGSVVQQINNSGVAVKAAVITDGTSYYVSLTNRDTGKPIGSSANGGLSITSDGSGLGLAVTQNATNAVLSVDGLPIESQNNDISTAIPGVTLTVHGAQTTPGDLVIATDSSKSASSLQTFIDSYNAIATSLQQSLRPDPSSPPVDGSTLDGSTVLTLEQRLHGLLSSQVVVNGSVRTLADIGVKLQNDGTLTLQSDVLNKAIAKDPSAVDAIFSTANTGLAAQVQSLSDAFTAPFDGQLVQRQNSLQDSIKDLTASNQRLQDHVDNYKLQLQRQFATMESLIASFNTIGSFISTAGIGLGGGSSSSSGK